MLTYRTATHSIVETPDSPLGSGGEAAVYAVNNGPDLVAKVYHPGNTIRGGRLTELGQRKEQKLTAMIENAPPTRDADGNVALSWPQDILYYYGGRYDGLMAGFTMPTIDIGQYRDIFNYYNPAMRRKLNETLAQKGLRVPTKGEDLENLLNVVIRNILTILGSIHSRGYVIGDVNESNILVDYGGRVAFVDSDSFQVRDRRNGIVHRSSVGKEDFLSPRVIDLTTGTCDLARCPSGKPAGRHNREFLCFDREAEDDSFAIAVILFKLLMNGAHPLDSIGGSQTYKERIANREFPFNHPSLSAPARSKRRWGELSPNWMNYFGYTFVTERRYSADEVLNLGHHLASKGGNNLGQQATVSYNTTVAGNSAKSTPAASQQWNPFTSRSGQPQQQNPAGPRGRQPQQQAPAGPRNRQAHQSHQLINCPQCRMPNPESKVFCQNPACLAILHGRTRLCASCKAGNPINARFCGKCGQAQP